jgi:hypothetical protein
MLFTESSMGKYAALHSSLFIRLLSILYRLAASENSILQYCCRLLLPKNRMEANPVDESLQGSSPQGYERGLHIDFSTNAKGTVS